MIPTYPPTWATLVWSPSSKSSTHTKLRPLLIQVKINFYCYYGVGGTHKNFDHPHPFFGTSWDENGHRGPTWSKNTTTGVTSRSGFWPFTLTSHLVPIGVPSVTIPLTKTQTGINGYTGTYANTITTKYVHVHRKVKGVPVLWGKVSPLNIFGGRLSLP